MNRLTNAIEFAARMHEGQQRKLAGGPYILHPMEAAVIASTLTDDEDVVLAALLHDVLEDTAATEEQLKDRFGDRVLALVLAETENKRRDKPANETWRVRKEETLAHLATASREVKILWLADKLSNIRSLANAYRKEGVAVFEAFNQKDPAEHGWYYRSVQRSIEEDLGDTTAYLEYKRLVELVFGKGGNNEK